MDSTRQSLIDEIKKRVQDRILEQTNADLLIKLITNADSLDEAINIAALGTTYKRTGLHFDKRLEKMGDDIRYFKKNEKLSFRTDDKKPVDKLIIGDNYQALQNLLIQYKNKIDVIYIDPPYGKDSMGEFAKTNYNNAITRDNLLSMLYSRLVLARQLLSDEGVIFCSIDDKNQAYVKCLFDEIFGEENFEGQIHWRRRNNQPNDKTKLLGIVAEHILAYSKNKEFHKEFGVGKVDLTGKFSNPDNDPRGEWASKPWKTGTNQTGTRYEIISPIGKVFNEEWMGDESTFESLKNDNRIIFPKNGNGFPRKKYFKSERAAEGQCASNWWECEEFGCNQDATNELKNLFNGGLLFENPKPVSLVKALIQLGSIKENSIVLDFFAGSGTTGHAVLDLNKSDDGNRTFILCQLNEKTDANPNGIAYDVTSKRLKRIMTGECYDGTKDFPWIQNNEPYGGNLDVYEIGEVLNSESTEGKTPFDVIDETLYGKEKFQTVKEKIEWVCQNFDKTQIKL
ncbi:site-specific DNA-methyltransferase [uncultured Treponema sp.]|uniref:site-specific DNA-methyltransferase n=1 Tax=uncultured Treponema sp. TaxID=162155 RepID=UPI002596C97C|nr:site-specific DNA-methyltransferase [uncultured Treponema sp.]